MNQPTNAQFFLACVDAAVADLPAPFRPAAEEVVVSVIDLPPREILTALEIDDPMNLTGLYEGIPLTKKSFAHQPMGPDTIWLYRLPILQEWRDRGNVDLRDLIVHVYVHELAHHFGWSDDDIAAIDPWWE